MILAGVLLSLFGHELGQPPAVLQVLELGVQLDLLDVLALEVERVLAALHGFALLAFALGERHFDLVLLLLLRELLRTQTDLMLQESQARQSALLLKRHQDLIARGNAP